MQNRDDRTEENKTKVVDMTFQLNLTEFENNSFVPLNLNSRGGYPVKFFPVAYNITNPYIKNFNTSERNANLIEVQNKDLCTVFKIKNVQLNLKSITKLALII